MLQSGLYWRAVSECMSRERGWERERVDSFIIVLLKLR